MLKNSCAEASASIGSSACKMYSTNASATEVNMVTKRSIARDFLIVQFLSLAFRKRVVWTVFSSKESINKYSIVLVLDFARFFHLRIGEKLDRKTQVDKLILDSV